MAPSLRTGMILVQLVIISACLLLVRSSTADQQTCKYEIVESMPDQLNFSHPIEFRPKKTHEALLELIDGASKTLNIASFYWTLTADSEFASHPSAEPGRKIMKSIINATKRGVKLQVILDGSQRKSMNSADDVKILESIGSVKSLNMTQILGSGVLHSKFLIADNKSLYLGSSNFDWRSYTQIKEIGIKFDQCEQVAQDLDKIFRTYVLIAEMGKIPTSLPKWLYTKYDMEHPMTINSDNLEAEVFITGSPPAFNGLQRWTGRSDDIDGLLSIVDSAKEFVDISVMNYSPRTEFIWPKKFWPRIDDALRRAAAERRVKVRLLFSNWEHAKPEELMWYRSLNEVNLEKLKGGRIHVKMFKVPAYDEFQKKIPYSRVKHDKYMVTERGLFIGTSNWSPDYFINTCGSSFVIRPKNRRSSMTNSSIISNMHNLFDRDFNSEFSKELNDTFR